MSQEVVKVRLTIEAEMTNGEKTTQVIEMDGVDSFTLNQNVPITPEAIEASKAGNAVDLRASVEVKVTHKYTLKGQTKT